MCLSALKVAHVHICLWQMCLPALEGDQYAPATAAIPEDVFNEIFNHILRSKQINVDIVIMYLIYLII